MCPGGHRQRRRSNCLTGPSAASSGDPKRLWFAIPLNVKHRHFNGSGRERALMVSTTDLPLVMNTFHNERFICRSRNSTFSERAGKESHYTGEGDLITVKPGNHMWETNFVPDLAAIELKTWGDRGAGGTNIMFVLADGTMPRPYLGNAGRNLQEGPPPRTGLSRDVRPRHRLLPAVARGKDQDFIRIDWQHGVVFPPAGGQFHQHFNTSGQPGALSRNRHRRLALSFTTENRRSLIGLKPANEELSRPVSRRAATRSSTTIRMDGSTACGSRR